MKKLRIGQIAPLNLAIPPSKYGGTERIIDALCKGLTKRGHEIFLFASGDSKTAGTLVSVIEENLWPRNTPETTPYHVYEMNFISHRAQNLRLDILHDHLGPLSLALYGHVQPPLIHTLHVPLNSARNWVYSKLNAKLVSISDNQRVTGPGLNYVATIYNGTDTEVYTYNPNPKNYFLFLGELSERKGIKEAIELAKKLNFELVIAGRIPTVAQPKDFYFFEQFVKPHLNQKTVHYVGEVDTAQAATLYGEAQATLFPIKWQEPFGLVLTESMSCGTPVIATRQGSVPEIIKDGVTGLIVDTIEEMEKALSKISSIDRAACRNHVEENFSLEKMVDHYEQAYYAVLKDNETGKST